MLIWMVLVRIFEEINIHISYFCYVAADVCYVLSFAYYVFFFFFLEISFNWFADSEFFHKILPGDCDKSQQIRNCTNPEIKICDFKRYTQTFYREKKTSSRFDSTSTMTGRLTKHINYFTWSLFTILISLFQFDFGPQKFFPPNQMQFSKWTKLNAINFGKSIVKPIEYRFIGTLTAKKKTFFLSLE